MAVWRMIGGVLALAAAWPATVLAQDAAGDACEAAVAKAVRDARGRAAQEIRFTGGKRALSTTPGEATGVRGEGSFRAEKATKKDALETAVGLLGQGMEPLQADCDNNLRATVHSGNSCRETFFKDRFHLRIAVANGVSAPDDIGVWVKKIGL